MQGLKDAVRGSAVNPAPEVPLDIHIDINMNIDIPIIINMNNNFGVGDHFQVLRVSERT